MRVGQYEITRADKYRHKYGDAMAEYLCTAEVYADEDGGDIAYGLYAQRFGKRILTEDDRGFVECLRFADEDEASNALAKFLEDFYAWQDEDEDEDDESGPWCEYEDEETEA